jgi:hypothetical protein
MALLLLDQIGQDAAEGVLRSLVAKAATGDVQAASLLLSRAWPVRKGRPIRFDMPLLARPADVVAAIAAITEQVAAGVLSAEEGHMICEMIETHRRALETQELEARVAALESKHEP